MAPAKRQRSVDDNGETEIVEIESAQSSLQQASRKKSRISHKEPEESEISEYGSDEERFQEQATQFLTQQRSKKILRNHPAENGIIESVICTNFMCHGYLEIGIGPLINFIIGHNGSGKSAILTAITICLGGKATATNRGQSLKSFIKEGEESAMLSVKIKNTGDGAYQQDIYGDSIIVERHFSRSGSSSFKLKSSTGRMMSTRKADLEDICDYYALQIDNPMNVLTQDMARQFLNNSTPTDKYKFFMKGTQLEHLDGDYLIVEQNLEAIDQDLWKKTEDLNIFRERYEKARHLLSLSEMQDTLRQRIKTLMKMMAWAQVEEREKELRMCNNKLARMDEKIEALEMKAAGLNEAFGQIEQSSEHAVQGVEDAKSALTPLQEEKDRIKKEHDRFKAEQMALHTEQRAIKGEIKAAEDRIGKAEKEIADEHQRLSDADGGTHDLRRAEIEEKREEANAAKRRFREHEDELPALEDNKCRAEREFKETLEPIKYKRADIQQAEDRLNSLMRDRGQQQQSYPQNMQRLLNAIRQDEGFQQKPIGPMGAHVRLLKPLWSSILEKSFGGALESFIVTSKQDQTRLSDLMDRNGCACQILITNNSSIDTRGKEPDERFDTALRVVDIDNDLVRKQLVINQGVDQTILIQHRKEAIDAMNNERLHNVKQCFSFNIRPGEAVRLAYGWGGGLSQSHQAAFRGSPRMKTDVEYQISSQRETLQTLRSELSQLEQISQEMQRRLTRCQQALTKHRNILVQWKIEMQQTQDVVDELQDALDNDRVEEGRLEALKEQLEDAKEDKSTYEASYGESVVAKDKNNESLMNTRDKMASMDAQIKEAEAKIFKAESKATRCANQRQAALRDMNAAFENVNAAKEERGTYTVEREQHVKIVEDFTKQASDFCQRVPVDHGETGDSIERKTAKLEKDLKEAEKRVGGSRAQLTVAAAKATEALDHAETEVRSIEELSQLLKFALVNRRDRWKQFQKFITARARVQFMYLLSERGFRGQLQANHKEKKLDLQVEPDETLRQNKGRKTMTLSGGEKSFSTICLLLSLWEAMGAPIRCLDEFDVFMDPVNRQISMGMMIQAARRSIGKQFILITPQSMSSIDPQEDVKVIKMADPERGKQARLHNIT
ncbi:hypothetical protein N7G274_007847 [Stereocaulon virgatum]|uniref:RecF/RecN/SMC N-terminal domain-containing protein n=1 Tax=Stereocaulon virgatum TaxID=373712 RepID=A0ABR4A128_9LECA